MNDLGDCKKKMQFEDRDFLVKLVRIEVISRSRQIYRFTMYNYG